MAYYHSFMSVLGGLYLEVEVEMTKGGELIRVLDVVQHGHDSVPMNLITVVHQGKQMTLAEAAALAFEEEDQAEIDASVAGLIGYDREMSRPLDAHKVAAE